LPLENWVHHSALWPFLYDWQTLLAGIFALGAAALTVLGTFTSANRQIDAANKQAEKVIAASREAADREVAASRDQIVLAQKQIEASLRSERRRLAREGYAFHAMVVASMERVLAEAGEAKTIFLSAKASATATSSPQAYEARQHFSKGAFPELRTACVRYGGRLTRELLELERDIDDFRSRTQGGAPSAYGAIPQLGLHAGFDDQLANIEAKANHLREEAATSMQMLNTVVSVDDDALAKLG
jgi:hypothetical protein